MNQNAPSSLLFVLSAALGACLCMAACGTSDGESLKGLFGGSAGGCPSLETPKARFCCQAARCFSEGGECSGSEIADSCNASEGTIAADTADQVVSASCDQVREVAYQLPLTVSGFAEGCGIAMQGGSGGGEGDTLTLAECEAYCEFFEACPDSGFSTSDFTCEEHCELFPDGVRCILGEVLEDGVYSCSGASAGLNCAGEFAGGFIPGF